MARSLAAGHYSLVMAIESASRPDSWYRICQDRATFELSCDCPSWTFARSQRVCKHTSLAQLLLTSTASPSAPGHTAARPPVIAPLTHPYVAATHQQWPGLGGTWSVEERQTRIGSDAYQIILLTLHTGNGDHVSGCAAFATRHHANRSLLPGIAGWIGYAISAEVCRRGNLPLAGAPPQHFRLPRRGSGRTSPGVVGLADILRIGDVTDLGDGLTPQMRAEQTLALFLGPLYTQLEQQHFLDVSSALYPHRVYRLRRDPAKQRERRVRVFEHGRYVKDFCIVRSQNVPEPDHVLTVFLRLLSDEAGALSVVGRHNIFASHSDDWQQHEDETIPAVWRPRAA